MPQQQLITSAAIVVEFLRGRPRLVKRIKDRLFFLAPEVRADKVYEMVSSELHEYVTTQEKLGLDRMHGNGPVKWEEVTDAILDGWEDPSGAETIEPCRTPARKEKKRADDATIDFIVSLDEERIECDLARRAKALRAEVQRLTSELAAATCFRFGDYCAERGDVGDVEGWLVTKNGKWFAGLGVPTREWAIREAKRLAGVP